MGAVKSASLVRYWCSKNDETLQRTANIYHSGVTKRERDEFVNSRSFRNKIPIDMTIEKIPWGIIEPYKSKTDIINKFKIYSTDPVIGKGKKTGRVCESYYDIDHTNFVKQKNNDDQNYKMKNKKILR